MIRVSLRSIVSRSRLSKSELRDSKILETLYLQSVIDETQRMNEEHVLKLKTIQAIRKAFVEGVTLSPEAIRECAEWNKELEDCRSEIESWNDRVANSEMQRIRALRIKTNFSARIV